MASGDWGRAPTSVWRMATAWRRSEFWLTLAGCLAGAGVLWFTVEPASVLLAHAAQARSEIVAFGPLAPLLYIAVFALQILIAPLPGQFLGVMSGYFFGAIWGSLYSVVGLILGAGIAMMIARRFGRRLVTRFVTDAAGRRWERKLRMRSPVTWGLLFVFPVPDLVFYIAGLSRVPLRHLLLAAVTGRSVGLVTANLFGTLSATLPPEWVIAKWMALGLVALLFYRYQRNVRLVVLRAIRRIQRAMRHWRRRRVAPTEGALP